MSLDEIRTQKALAFLEFTEAEEKVARLEKDRQLLARELHSFASALDKIPGAILESFDQKYKHLTPQMAYELLQNLQEAKKQLADAAAKKNQFAL